MLQSTVIKVMMNQTDTDNPKWLAHRECQLLQFDQSESMSAVEETWLILT